MKKFTKKYQVWNYGEGWSFEEYDTIQECLEALKYSTDFYITKSVDFEVKEIIN